MALRSPARFNSNGLTDPDFHVPGRLETRTLSGLWLDRGGSLAAVSPLARALPRLGQGELQYLSREGRAPRAGADAGDWWGWSAALASDEALAANWWRDMYRSHRLDILDDLSGKSCGPLTLRRLDWLEQAVQEHFPALVDNLAP